MFGVGEETDCEREAGETTADYGEVNGWLRFFGDGTHCGRDEGVDCEVL